MIFNRKQLQEKLNILGKAYNPKTPMPSLQFIKFDNDRLIMSNNEISIICEVESTNLRVLLPFRQLYDIICKLKNDEVELNVVDNKAIIKSGRSRYSLSCGNYEEYPKINILDNDGINISSSKFKNIINSITYACSKNEKRPILTGVNFNNNYSVATDSFRLAKFEDTVGLECTIAQNDLNNLVAILPDNCEVFVRNTAIQAQFEFGGIIYQTRLLDGRYPDLSRLFSGEYNIHCIVSRCELIDAVERVNILNSEEHNIIRLSISESEIELKNHTSQIGEAKEFLDCRCDTKIVINCNSSYLVDSLKKFSGDTVTINIVSSEKPFIITEDKLSSLILPVRMN